MIKILVLGTYREWGGYLDKLKRANPDDWKYNQMSRRFETSHTTYWFISIGSQYEDGIEYKLMGTEYHDIIYLESCGKGLTMREYQYAETRKRLQVC